MSHYVNIPLRIEDFDTIIQSLMDEAVKEETFFDVHKLVFLIDYLQQKYEEDINAQNLKLRKWQEYEKLYVEYGEYKDNLPDPIYFMGVHDILQKYMDGDVEDGSIDLKDPVNMFSLIVEICEFFLDNKE
jgi:hypothetical protein